MHIKRKKRRLTAAINYTNIISGALDAKWRSASNAVHKAEFTQTFGRLH
jgi:hypothetical protein